jgi:hypothetical protein
MVKQHKTRRGNKVGDVTLEENEEDNSIDSKNDITKDDAVETAGDNEYGVSGLSQDKYLSHQVSSAIENSESTRAK